MIRRDVLWKGVIEDFFPEMMLWFYPEQADAFDFSQVEFLDKELQQLVPEAESSERRADKLVKLGLKSGSEQWVLIHIEIQGYKDSDFEHRMFQYYYRILDRYNIRVEPLVILTDPHRTFRPRQYEVQGFRSRLLYEFYACKLLELPSETFTDTTNPFNIVLRTAWEAIHQRNPSDDTLMELKIQLFRNLLEAGFEKGTISRLSKFIRNYVSFEKPEMAQQLDTRISQLTKDVMARGIIERVNEEYKRIWKEEGLAEGKEQGKELQLRQTISLLLTKDLTKTQIADLLEVPMKMVEEVAAKDQGKNA